MIHHDFPNLSLNGNRDPRIHEEARLAYSERIGPYLVEIWAAPIWGHRGFGKTAKRALDFWLKNGRRDRMVTGKAYPGYFLIEEAP